MLRAYIQQMNNPDPELEKRTNLLKKQRQDLYDFRCKKEAMRHKSQG